MKKFHVFLCLLLALCTIGMTGCDDQAQTADSNPPKSENTASEFQNGPHNNATVIEDQDYGFQLEPPEKGEEVAVLHTSMGDIYIRLFPQYAPKTVENFKGLINKGYYDGLIFHRVINNFMIQGGDPLGTGTGGESLWGDAFEDEFCDKLNNIRGSLAMANSGVNTNQSQFFINQAGPDHFDRNSYDYDSIYASYKQAYNAYCANYSNFKDSFPTVDAFIEYNGGIAPNSHYIPEKIWKLYEKNGGNISLDGAWRDQGGHSVFGQVFKGMDVVDKIAAVEVNSENDKPLQDVVITKAELIKY